MGRDSIRRLGVCKAVDESLAPACAHGKDGLSQYISEIHPVGFDEQ